MCKDLLSNHNVVPQIVVDMYNNNQVTYTGMIYVGSRNIPNEVVFDTGSGWLTVTTM